MKNLHTFEEFLNEQEEMLNEAEKFKSTKDFEKFLEEIDGMPEARIRKIMGKDYIDTPGGYRDEADDYDNDITEYMISNMGRKEFEKLKAYWETNIMESVANESRDDWRELEGNDMDSMLDAISFLSRGTGLEALEKELKTKMPFQLIGSPMAHPKGGGMYTAAINFIPKTSTKLKTEDIIVAANKVLSDHGYDKHKIQILK